MPEINSQKSGEKVTAPTRHSPEKPTMHTLLDLGPLTNNSTIVGALRGVFQVTEMADWTVIAGIRK